MLAILIQKIWRGYYRRRKFLSLKKSQVVIAATWRSWKVSMAQINSLAFLYNNILGSKRLQIIKKQESNVMGCSHYPKTLCAVEGKFFIFYIGFIVYQEALLNAKFCK